MPTLDFKGKQFVYSHHHSVPFRELVIDEEKSLPEKNQKPSIDDNLIINGDNLHALKALMPLYAGKVKCIYIDPPYNTGNEGWCYNDNVNSPLMKEWLAKNANPVDKEDLQRHDKWLCMMYPRLKLLHELLADDGVIFVSIDDNEVHHLRAVMDEIFGEGNFVAELKWKKKKQPSFLKTHIAGVMEYVLVFSKNKNKLEKLSLDNVSDLTKKVVNLNNLRAERLFLANMRVKCFDEGLIEKGIYKIKTTEIEYLDDVIVKNGRTANEFRMRAQFTNTQEKITQFIIDDLIFITANKSLRRDVSEVEMEKRKSITDLLSDGWGDNQDSEKEIDDIFGDKEFFEYPKPTKLIKNLIKSCFSEDCVILDSFAGSGTTAHAVLDLNKEDGGNRKFILVEMEDYANSITAERVRRVIKGVPNAKDEKLKNGLGGSFTFCKLGDEFNIEKILTGEALPKYEALANYVFYTATGKSLETPAKQRIDYFVGETDLYEVYLIYQPDIAFLRSNESALNAKMVEIISNRESKKQKLVFASAKYMGQNELNVHKIIFCQLPYAIHKITTK